MKTITRNLRLAFCLFLASTFALAQSAGVGQIWTVVTGTLQSAATANGNGTVLSVSGLSSAIMTVNCSVACTGGTTINFEGSQDGTNYVSITAVKSGSPNVLSSTVLNQSTTITAWEMPIAGFQLIRARISGYNAGTITVTANATGASYNNKAIAGSLLPAAGTPTYAASKLGLATAASATDIAVLSGNATNTVVPVYVSLSCLQTTAGIVDVRLLIRTTADSGGTSTGSPTSFPLDQNNAAAVSSVLTYTANPTVNDGTDRIVDSQKVGMMAAATAVPNDIYVWRPTLGQSVVLRGTAQQLAVNLNGVTVTGSSCDVTYRWLEVPNY